MYCTIDCSTSGATGQIKICGNFNLNHRAYFRNVCNELLQSPDIKKIEVLLDDVARIDSSALGMLLTLNEQAKSSGKTIFLKNPVGIVAKSLQTVNFEQLFPIEGLQKSNV